MNTTSAKHEPALPETDQAQTTSSPPLEAETSAVEYTSESTLSLVETSFLSIVDQTDVIGGLSAPVIDVVNSPWLTAKDEYRHPSTTLRTLLSKADAGLTYSFGLFKTENNLPDNFLSDDHYDGAKSYWSDISQPLINIANQVRTLLADASDNSSRPLPDGRLYTANNVEVPWYSSARNHLLHSSPAVFKKAVDAATEHEGYREPYLPFSDWINENLGSIDKSAFKDEKDLLQRCLSFLERADVQIFSARLLKEMLPEYSQHIGSRTNLRLTAYAMARWSYEDTLAPFDSETAHWSADPENSEDAENKQSEEVMTLPIPAGSKAVDIHFARGLQRIALDAYCGGLRQVERTLKAFSDSDSESVFSILPQDPCASVLTEEQLHAKATERWGQIKSITEALYPHAFYPYFTMSDDITEIALAELRTLSSIDDATRAVSYICRRPDLHRRLSDFTGVSVQSGEGAWDVLRRLVRSLVAPAGSITDNGFSSIPAFIAPLVSANPDTALLELIFRGTLVTRQYIPASAWRPGIEPPKQAEIPIPETLLFLEDPDATFAANRQLLQNTLGETAPTPALASRLLDKMGLSATFIQALPTWATLEHYQLLQGLPVFSEWAAKMTQSPTPASSSPLTPGEQSYLLVETLLSIAWPAVKDMWQLEPDLIGTITGPADETWSLLKERLIQAVHQRLMDENVTDKAGHATFLAGLLLQRARPELFLRDTDSLTRNYQSDIAAITLRWAARLLNEITPRASLAHSIADVVTMAWDLATQNGIDIGSQPMNDAPVASSAEGSTENPFSELVGLILGDQITATARAWGYEDAMEWVNLTKAVEERNQALLLSVEHERAPDLRAMASVQLWALGVDPDAPFGDQDVNMLDAFLCNMNMTPRDLHIAQRTALLKKFMDDSTLYKEKYKPIIKSQLELIFQNLPLQRLQILNTGRWRLLTPSSRHSLFYKSGTLAIVEFEPVEGNQTQFLNILKSDDGLGTSWIDIWSRSAMLLPKPASVGGRLRRSGIPAGVGLEAGEWHAGLNAGKLYPSDPDSTAHQIINDLVMSVWDTPMTWELNYSMEQETLLPAQRGERFNLLSLIPFYDYFSKPAAERNNEEHLTLALEVLLTALPAAKGVGSAFKTLGKATRAGLQTSLGQGLKSQVFSIGQHGLTTSAGETVRRTAIGGLWQTLNHVGSGASASLANQALRKGLRKSGLQLTYAAGESLYVALPWVDSPRLFVRATNKLWQHLHKAKDQAVEVLNYARQLFRRQLYWAVSYLTRMFSTQALGSVSLEETLPVRHSPRLDFFLDPDTRQFLVKRIPEANSAEVHAVYKKTANNRSDVVFTHKFLVKNPDESWNIAVRDRNNTWATFTPKQLFIYHEQIENMLPSPARRSQFYVQMQGDALQSQAWKKLHETTLDEARTLSISRHKRSAPESTPSPAITPPHR